MALFIHLFDERDAAKIRRGGIKASEMRARKEKGVYVSPQVENYVVAHQWMRELRRRAGKIMLAARIRIPDDEPVLLGRFNEEHLSVTAAEAIGIVGWRYYPKAHGKKPCACLYCQRGEPFSRRLK